MKSPLTFRPAARSDLQELAQLYRTFDEEGAPPADPERILRAYREIAHSPRRSAWVVCVEDYMVAAYTLTYIRHLAHNGARSAVMEDVAVSPRFRSRGIGRAMIEHALGQCAAAGCYKLALSSGIQRVRAHSFYRRAGFRIHGVSFHVPCPQSDGKETLAYNGIME